jgi:hypothetical protein
MHDQLKNCWGIIIERREFSLWYSAVVAFLVSIVHAAK